MAADEGRAGGLGGYPRSAAESGSFDLIRPLRGYLPLPGEGMGAVLFEKRQQKTGTPAGVCPAEVSV